MAKGTKRPARADCDDNDDELLEARTLGLSGDRRRNITSVPVPIARVNAPQGRAVLRSEEYLPEVVSPAVGPKTKRRYVNSVSQWNTNSDNIF